MIKPLFTNKGFFGGTLNSWEKEIQKDDIAEELNLFFSNSIKSVNITVNTYIANKFFGNVIDPVDRAIEKFKTHPDN